MQVRCDNCGIQFEKRKDKRSSRGVYKNFCSQKCYFESKKNGACIDCGSNSIIQHEYKCYPKKICGACLEKRKNERHLIRAESWKKEWEKEKREKCFKCGKIISSPKRLLKGKFGLFFCKDCKNKIVFDNKRFKFCEYCGRLYFDWFNKNNRLFCSRKCSILSNHANFKRYNVVIGKCQDCGCEINQFNRGHKSNGYVCAECMYIRRRKYKDKKIYGGEFIDLLKKIRLVEASGNAFEQKTKGRIEKCRSPKKMNWAKVVRQLKK